MEGALAESTLGERVAAMPWYHTLELPGGLVTRGIFDLRPVRDRVGLPASMAGMRCLDVGSADGFWAFEMERRGAREVLSVDLEDASKVDWHAGADAVPPAFDLHRARRAFDLAKEVIGSRVERHGASVYEVSPERFGTFDFVVMGSLLLHLQDPARALGAVRTVVGGQFLSIETVSLILTALLPARPAALLGTSDSAVFWWTMNRAAHRRLLRMAGFEVVASGGPLFEPMGSWRPRLPRSRPRLRQLSYWAFHRQFGIPTCWVLARPAADTATRVGATVRCP
jgi:tRNA (mo5U34)-methyltransferase